MLTDYRVRIVIQESNEFFQKPKATDARFHTALCTFRTRITTLLQSKING